MEKYEYEKLIEMIKMLETVTDWRSYFGNKTTIFNNEEKNIVDVIDQIKSAESYETLNENFKAYDEWVDDINKAVTAMQQFVKFNGGMQKDDNSKSLNADINAASDEADKNFFGATAKIMAQARKDSWKNSTEFDKMENDLKQLNKIINGEIKVPEAEKAMKIYEALDNLEKSTNKYLEHKAKKGINENAIAKVDAAKEMKDYIKERKSEIFRSQMINETNAKIESKKGSTANFTDYDKKSVEIDNTKTHIIEMAGKLNLDYDKKQAIIDIFDKAEYLAFCGTVNFKEEYMKDYNMEEHAEALITAEFMRNELINGCGEITPVMEKFFRSPEAFTKAMNMNITGASKELYNSDKLNAAGLKKFVSQDPATNMNEIYKRCPKLQDRKFLEFAVSGTMYRMDDAKAEAKKQDIEKIDFEILTRQELEQAEAKEIEDKYNENLKLAKSWGSVAKFAKENLSGKDGKEILEKSSKYAKKYQEKAMSGMIK